MHPRQPDGCHGFNQESDTEEGSVSDGTTAEVDQRINRSAVAFVQSAGIIQVFNKNTTPIFIILPSGTLSGLADRQKELRLC